MPSRAEPSVRARVRVVGSGALASALTVQFADKLADEGSPTVVMITVGEEPADDIAGAHASLHVEIGRQNLVIGPALHLGGRGCLRCVRTRRETIAGSPPPARPPASLTRAASRFATAIVVDEVERLIGAHRPPRTRCAQLVVRLAGLDVRRHRFLPDPHCPACAPPRPTGPPELSLRKRPKAQASGLRVRDLDERALLDTYVDPLTGLVPELTATAGATFPFTGANLAVPGLGVTGAGYARTSDYRSGRSIAIIEALERLIGFGATKNRESVRGRFRSIREDAVDPRTLGLYPDQWYDQPRFPHQRFHEDLELDWVWGYSFARQRPVLVPERIAAYRLQRGDEPTAGVTESLADEVSNGCALGGCPEEAILHGILEVAERDAALMTWYARLAAPRIDLRTTSIHTQLVAERLAHRHGCAVHAFCTTLEHGIPTFWVIAEDTTGRPDRPRMLCATGSSLDPDQGLRGALHELAQTVQYGHDLYPARRAEVRRQTGTPALVHSIDDHLLTAADPAAAERFGFLPPRSAARPFDSLAELWRPPHPSDLTEDLRGVAARFLDTGLDIITVDHTTSDHTAGGFSAVKVIIPGTVPLTFGHRNRRIHGIARLDQRLGAALPIDYPHPFP